MGKKTWTLSIAGLTVLILAGREWFIHQEIKSHQELLRSQIKEQFELAQDVDRLQNLSLAPFVYDRYLEPVFVSAHKLLWPLSRESAMNSWRRDVHTRIDDEVYQRKLKLKAEIDAEIAKIQTDEEPSIARLVKVLDAKSRMLADTSIRQSIHDEIQRITARSREDDLTTLREIRSTGIDIVKSFKKKITPMDSKALGQFLVAGRFNNEVQQPVLDLIFKLKQEETRRRTWAEFQKTLLDILQSKKVKLASAKTKDQSKKFEALFDSVAEAIKKEESVSSADRLKVTEPSGITPTRVDTVNPASIDYRR